MAESIKFNLDADIAGFVARIRTAGREIDKFKRREEKLALASGARRLERNVNTSVTKMKRHFDSFDKAIQMTGKMLSKTLGLAIKGAALQMAGLGAAMLAIHASFAVGRGLMKAYSGAMKLVAQGGAAIAIALSTAAAAMREQQAAMFAYKGKGASQLGSGLNQTRAAMRSYATDANLAMLGTQNLNKAYGAMAKSMTSTQIAGQRNIFKALLDFGSAGQDPGAAAEKIGAVIAALNDTKKSFADVQNAAKELGPEMEKALKDAGVKSKKQFRDMLSSGELAKAGGVFGQYEAVNNTLINQAKAFFTSIKEQFADFGQKFLAPAKKAMQDIFHIIQRDLTRVSAELSVYGESNFFDGLVNAIDKISNFFVNLIRKWLPGSKGVLSGIGDWMERFKRGWNIVLDRLRPFIEGAKVLESVLKPIFTMFGSRISSGMQEFNQQLQDNRKPLEEFGQRIANLLGAIMDVASKFREIFFKSLPFINSVLSGLTTAAKLLGGMLGGLGGSFGGFGGTMALMVMFKAMAKNKGGFLPGSNQTVRNMNVQNMNVGGVPMRPPTNPTGVANRYGGPGTSPVGMASGAMSSLASSGGASAAVPTMGYLSGFRTLGFAGGLANAGARYYQRRKAITDQYTMASQGPLGVSKSFSSDAELIAKRQEMINNLGSKRGVPSLTSMRMRNLRESHGYGAVFGNEKTGQIGLNQRTGVRMGATLGLGLASQFAPEEMRGALALGSTVGMFNPLAGLAVGLGGAAMNAQGRGQGAVMGAGAGAVAGKMVGAILPAFGPMGAALAPLAPLIGGALGAIGGAILGGANKIKKESKAARAAVSAGLEGFTQGLVASANGVLEMNKKILESGGTVKNVGAFEGLGARYGRGTAATMESARAGIIDKRAGVVGRGRDTMAKFVDQMSMGQVRRFVADLPGLGFLKRANRVIDFGKNLIGGESQQTKAEKKAVAAIVDNMQRGGANLTEQQIEDMNKRRKQTIEQYLKETEAMNKAGKAMDDVYNARLDELEAISGKTRPELELLAQQMGVNLYDSTTKFNDVLKKLGLGMPKTADQIRQAFTDSFVEGLDFEQIKKQLEAGSVYNEVAETFKQQILSPEGATFSQGVDFLSGLSRATLDKAGGDPLKAAFDMAAQLGYKGSTGAAFGTGGVFAGMQMPPELKKLLDEKLGSTFAGFQGTAAQQVTDIFTQQGLSVDRQAVTRSLANMSSSDLERLYTSLQSGTFDVSNFGGEGGSRVGLEQAGKSLLGAYGMGGIEVERRAMEGVDKLANTMAEQTPEFVNAVKSFVSKTDTVFENISTPPWLKNQPAWWNGTAIPTVEGGDTRMPRGSAIGDTTSSRLATTMARHNAINSGIAGKRTITSSFRTYALGSANSDHATGRALDIVGANLGQYRRDITAAGGFAEFHGRGASRHLHVVPGPGAIGDTVAPSISRQVSTMTAKPATSSGGNNYTFNINGSTMSPEQIANTVMARIKQTERSERQRS